MNPEGVEVAEGAIGAAVAASGATCQGVAEAPNRSGAVRGGQAATDSLGDGWSCGSPAADRQRFYGRWCSASMSSASPEEDLEQINVKVTESFREEIDATWQGRGYNSRSEFIRDALRDAVAHPTFDRDELLAIALGERAIREGRTHSREEILDAFDLELKDEPTG